MNLKDLSRVYSIMYENYNDWKISLSFERKRNLTLFFSNEDIVNMELLPIAVYQFIAELLAYGHIDNHKINIEMKGNRFYLEFYRLAYGLTHGFDNYNCGHTFRRGIVEESFFNSTDSKPRVPVTEEINRDMLKLIEERRPLLDEWLKKRVSNISTNPYTVAIFGDVEGIKGEYLYTPNIDIEDETLKKIFNKLKKEYKTVGNSKNAHFEISKDMIGYFNDGDIPKSEDWFEALRQVRNEYSILIHTIQ